MARTARPIPARVRILAAILAAVDGDTHVDPDTAGELHFVTLATTADAGHVLPAIAREIGLSQVAALPLERAIAAAIGDRDMLLIIDNAEHIAEHATVQLRCPKCGTSFRVEPPTGSAAAGANPSQAVDLSDTPASAPRRAPADPFAPQARPSEPQ